MVTKITVELIFLVSGKLYSRITLYEANNYACRILLVYNNVFSIKCEPWVSKKFTDKPRKNRLFQIVDYKNSYWSSVVRDESNQALIIIDHRDNITCLSEYLGPDYYITEISPCAIGNFHKWLLYKCFMSLFLIVIQTNIKFLKITFTWTNIW